MKIVALWGKGERGKTTTLKMLLVKLIEKYGVTATDKDGNTLTIDELKAELASENLNYLPKETNCKNYAVTFELNGVKYGLSTHGDNESVLKTDFSCFTGCDVVFCATKTKGGSVKAVKEQKGDIIWVAKTSITGRKDLLKNPLENVNYSNQLQVDILLKIFEDL